MTRGSLARLFGLSVIWGSSFLLMKFALEGMSPSQLVLGRLIAGTLVLLVVVKLAGERLPARGTIWLHLAFMAVVANIAPFFLFAWGEQRVTSGMAGILNGSTPLFTLAIAILALSDERLSLPKITGLLLGFFGVVVVVGPWDSGGEINAVSGQIACLIAAACYGVGIVYARRFITPRALGPLSLSAGQLLLATVLLAVTAPVTMRGAVTFTPLAIGSVVVLGAVGTGLAYLLFYRLIHDVGATSASLVTYLIPVIAVFLGVLVQDDPLTWNVFVGAAIVVISAAMAEGRIGPRPVTEAPAIPVPEEVAR
jgi:drug/metabolite transporter (DMT)-like permease